jgi:2-(1,2-epoxy-1,2-dihydrophenyl)acetyl-CoA isomerase
MFEVSDDGPIRRIVIDDPGAKNAIPREGWEVLARHLVEFEASDARALILTGRGDDFCSGARLSEEFLGPGDVTVADRQSAMNVITRAATALYRLSKPVVAAVDGVAVGAGMNLALGCDIVIATDRARFGEIFVRRGLTMDFGGTWLLPRLVGLAAARDLALTGRLVDAVEARALGLVARVVAPADLEEAATATALALAAGAPLAQRFIKQGLGRSSSMSFEESLAYEEQAQALCLSSADAAEGIAAFLGKRPPEFHGR